MAQAATSLATLVAAVVSAYAALVTYALIAVYYLFEVNRRRAESAGYHRLRRREW